MNSLLGPLLIQIVKMFLLMFVGYYLYKQKVFNDETVKQVGNFLLRYVIPSVLVTSFIREFNMEEFKLLGMAFALSILVIGIGIIVANILFKGDKIIERFASIFTNSSFVGIPIIIAMFGQDAVFYLSAYVAVFIILVWTYGIYMMTSDKKEVSFKKVITNPNTIAVIVGLILYCTPITLPTIIEDVFRSIGSMNTPLSMIVLGTYLAKDSILKLFVNKKCYLVALTRLIIIPLLTILFLKFIPNEYMTLKLIILVANSVPCANTLAIFAQMFNRDYTTSAHIISFTTLLSIVSIPLVVVVAQMFW
ncbi:MAG: AEC family transporter [Longicatena sp.]|jgi:malate permease and related proteins|uniref:AEC family transporter n=1 Tax=Anaerorhabdus sp. TaxID=1872524 RepID=UPI002FC8A2BB